MTTVGALSTADQLPASVFKNASKRLYSQACPQWLVGAAHTKPTSAEELLHILLNASLPE